MVRRMVTDLEMKGVLREAQVCFNLCVNLRPGDNLFQEQGWQGLPRSGLVSLSRHSAAHPQTTGDTSQAS